MPGSRFLVVGVGASAGGVEALQAFFKPMPAEPGMAFIVITHMPEGHESAMAQILARSTAMPVSAIGNNERPEINHVYVLTSDALTTISRGRMRLRKQPASRRERNIIDILFASLAEDLGENAVGVILSGSGHDGTLGSKAIKEKGGLTIAQLADHTAPRYPDMPAHAIASGSVDLKLPVEQMAGKLVEYAHTHGVLEIRAIRENHAVRDKIEQARQTICAILLQELGHNFSGYKERTFLRRIERRMQVLELLDINDYVDRLRKDHDEVAALFNDLLIGVTAFFRDQDAFDALAGQVIPKLFENMGANDMVRVWVPGCATGEEVYSIAILLLERMASMRVRPKVSCFATDIDEMAIGVARAGRYPAALLETVSRERLDRFFINDGVSYTVTKEVRDICIFSAHSVIRDPPFSRIDLVSCRNLLIYLGRELQLRLVPLFHYALRPGGYLFLGTSESLTQHDELFSPLESKHRIYRRRDFASTSLDLPLALPPSVRRAGALELRYAGRSGAVPLRPIAENRIIEQFAPAHVVVTRDGDVVHFSTRTGKYLENAPGAPSRQLIAMARRGLRPDLRAAFTEAVEMRRPVRRSSVQVEIDDRIQIVDLAVEPLPEYDAEPLFLVVFSDIGAPIDAARMVPAISQWPGGSSEEIEAELRQTRERLQATIEEYETALEELKSANEELVSINEELQSTNEELETSREEAQSINEELNTVNSELQRKVEELDRANDDLRNLFEGTEIATVFLDRRLMIRSFTPAVRDIFNLKDIDRGRPLTDIVSELQGLDLRNVVEPVLAGGQAREAHVARRDGRAIYLMRVLPYQSAGRDFDGLVLTFTNITQLTEVEEFQREVRDRIARMLGRLDRIARDGIEHAAAPGVVLGRMTALTGLYRLLLRAHWRSIPLNAVAAAELARFGIGLEGRVTVGETTSRRPAVNLRPLAVVAIGTALHELATDAVIHGALSIPSGRVHLDWEVAEPDTPQARLVIRWREADGPRVDGAQPVYNRDRIEGGLAEIGGAAAFEFSETGLSAELLVPLAGSTVLSSEIDDEANGPGGIDRPGIPRTVD